MKSLSLIVFCALVAGCHSYQTRTYDVSVKNFSTGPVTLWLTKDGPPFEPGWLAPEDLAIESPKAPRVISGIIVQSGKEAFTGPRTGRFEPQTNAVLRIYGGQLKFEQILATNRDDRSRIDRVLHPGENHLIVTGTPDLLTVKDQEPKQ